MTVDAAKLLRRIYDAGGFWPDVLARSAAGRELMRIGHVELIKPPAPYLPYARLTISGRRRAELLADVPRETNGR